MLSQNQYNKDHDSSNKLSVTFLEISWWTECKNWQRLWRIHVWRSNVSLDQNSRQLQKEGWKFVIAKKVKMKTLHFWSSGMALAKRTGTSCVEQWNWF